MLYPGRPHGFSTLAVLGLCGRRRIHLFFASLSNESCEMSLPPLRIRILEHGFTTVESLTDPAEIMFQKWDSYTITVE
jgi:hypothetical protein